MVVTFIAVLYVCYRVNHELMNRLLGNLFLLLTFFITNKYEFQEEKLIMCDRIDITWTNGLNSLDIGQSDRKSNFSQVGEKFASKI